MHDAARPVRRAWRSAVTEYDGRMHDGVARHKRAAAAHEGATARHEQAARFWADRGDEERADLERRNAEIERAAAELERDRAALARSNPRPERAE